MLIIQPVSQSMGWQVEISPRAPCVVKCPTGVSEQRGSLETRILSWLRRCPLALRHPMESWGGWDGAAGEQEHGGRVPVAPLTVVQIRSCLR